MCLGSILQLNLNRTNYRVETTPPPNFKRQLEQLTLTLHVYPSIRCTSSQSASKKRADSLTYDKTVLIWANRRALEEPENYLKRAHTHTHYRTLLSLV